MILPLVLEYKRKYVAQRYARNENPYAHFLSLFKQQGNAAKNTELGYPKDRHEP